MAISLGCSPMGPSVIQRLAPFASRPTPGTCTSARAADPHGALTR
ncbi:MAG: hypothetical protein ACKOHI_00590 [Phycisphaerales bacterium]